MSDRTVVSLSTIPPRFSDLGPTLESLLRQNLPVDEVRLYIPRSYRRFPDWDGALPDVPVGVTIYRCDEDLGPATKVLPACKDLRGQSVDVLFCDDDKLYDPEWHGRFKAMRAEKPDVCIIEAGESFPDIADADRPAERLPRCQRRSKGFWYRLMRIATLTMYKPYLYVKSGYVDQISGYGGVMVRPDWFDDLAWDIPGVMWTVDDPWLSGHLERANVPIWLNASGVWVKSRSIGNVFALLKHVENGADRVEADLAVINYFRSNYGIWAPSRRPAPCRKEMTESMRVLAFRHN